jgi:uncharacterized protein (UPF0335 family)
MLQPERGNFMSASENIKMSISVAGGEPIHTDTKTLQKAAKLVKNSIPKPRGFHEVDDAPEVEAKAEKISEKYGLPKAHVKKELRAGSVSAEQLRTIIQRVEKLEEDKAAIGGDIREVLAEAKGNGFDLKAIKQILKIRRMDENERAEQTAILETYMGALGMLPLFEGLEE